MNERRIFLLWVYFGDSINHFAMWVYFGGISTYTLYSSACFNVTVFVLLSLLAAECAVCLVRRC